MLLPYLSKWHLFSRGDPLVDWDLYRSLPRELTEASTSGATLSIVGIVFMGLVFLAELWAFLSVGYVTDVILDPNQDSMIRVSFNISIPDLPCEYVSLDVVDVLGTRKEGITQNVNKWAIDGSGSIRGFMGRNDDLEKPLAIDSHHDGDELKKDGEQAESIDADQFDDYLAEHRYVFANFYAPWCIWCQRLEPVWEAFAESALRHDVRKVVKVVKIDCVKNHAFCIEHKVQAFPTLRFYTGGEAHMSQYQSDRTVSAFERFVDEQLDQDHYVATIRDPEKRAEAHEKRVQEARETHDSKKGCNLVGFLMLNRVPGNFHILARSENHNMNPSMANLTHVVHKLYFGNTMTNRVKRLVGKIPEELFDAKTNLAPLDDRVFTTDALHKAYHHYLKVVSTHFQRGSYKGATAPMVYQMLESSQVMSYGADDVPEARFSFDLSPMAVVISRESMALYEFVTHICALLGGTFTVIGLMSGALNVIFKPKRL